jgi:hypothetical protein
VVVETNLVVLTCGVVLPFVNVSSLPVPCKWSNIHQINFMIIKNKINKLDTYNYVTRHMFTIVNYFGQLV